MGIFSLYHPQKCAFNQLILEISSYGCIHVDLCLCVEVGQTRNKISLKIACLFCSQCWVQDVKFL